MEKEGRLPDAVIACVGGGSNAIAYARKIAPVMRRDQIIVITISGRGDKDCAAIARYRGEDIHD